MEEQKIVRRIDLKVVFYLEAVINLVVVILCIFFPSFFIGQFTTITLQIPGIEIIRWYGILLLVITLILLGALITKKYEFIRIVLISYLIGDIAQIGATIYFALKIATWNFAIIFTMVITVILIVFRILVLSFPMLIKEKKIT
ncbi:MAG: hypothetical protein GF308_07050 [Candidatus Heimdallarchaeota archaeon]|nr:hypothetical protein [Candidatus Heimdallarchaeota archaeon]